LKNTLYILTFTFFVLTSPAGAESIYKEGWSESTVAKMELDCTKDLYLLAITSIENNKEKLNLTESEKKGNLDKKLQVQFHFCNCVWDKIARKYSVNELYLKTKGIKPEEKAKFFISEYSVGECR
jgi:hypothetical protein